MGRAGRSRLLEAVPDGPSSSIFPKRRRVCQTRAKVREETSESEEEETVQTEEEEEEEYAEESQDDGMGNEQEGAGADNCGGKSSAKAADTVEQRKTGPFYGGLSAKAANTAERRKNGPISVILTDPQILDCPICFESLTIPVYQCDNGHVVCNSCSVELMNKCPSCQLPTGHNRSRAIEKVLESIQVTCKNAEYGCKETVSYDKKYDHEEACHYAPCYCPITNCGFAGSSGLLCQHFRVIHKNSAVQFLFDKVLHITLNVHHKLIVLQESKEGDLFVLDNSIQTHGHGISVSCIAPSWKGGIFYSILVRSGGIAYKFQSCTKSIRRWDNSTPKVASILVPSDFFGSYGMLKMEIRIQRPKK